MPDTATVAQEVATSKKLIAVWNWRGSHSAYRQDLPKKFAQLMITDIVWVTQSESDGNVAITVFYR